MVFTLGRVSPEDAATNAQSFTQAALAIYIQQVFHSGKRSADSIRGMFSQLYIIAFN